MIHPTTFRLLREDYLQLPREMLELLNNSAPQGRHPGPSLQTEEGTAVIIRAYRWRWAVCLAQYLFASKSPASGKALGMAVVCPGPRAWAKLMMNQSCLQDCIKSEEPSPWTRVMVQAPPALGWDALAPPDSDKPHLQPSCINHFQGVPAPFFQSLRGAKRTTLALEAWLLVSSCEVSQIWDRLSKWQAIHYSCAEKVMPGLQSMKSIQHRAGLPPGCYFILFFSGSQCYSSAFHSCPS